MKTYSGYHIPEKLTLLNSSNTEYLRAFYKNFFSALPSHIDTLKEEKRILLNDVVTLKKCAEILFQDLKLKYPEDIMLFNKKDYYFRDVYSVTLGYDVFAEAKSVLSALEINKYLLKTLNYRIDRFIRLYNHGINDALDIIDFPTFSEKFIRINRAVSKRTRDYTIILKELRIFHIVNADIQDAKSKHDVINYLY